MSSRKAATSKAATSKAATSKAATSKASAKAAKVVVEDPEDEDEPTGNSLDEHIKLLSDAGKSREMISLLVSTTSAEFNAKWGKTQSFFTDPQWQAAQEIFINSREWVRKDQNVYLNEIRERALLFIVNLTNDKIDAFSIDESIKQFLKQLRDIWIGRICDCRDTFILEKYPDDDPGIEEYLSQYNDTTFNKLIRKGGRSSRWDFELNDTVNASHSVKIELKFSSTGKTGVDELAQFVALNLEGTVANSIFGASYLDFFARESFLQRMVDMCNLKCGAGTLTIPSDINDWKKAAAATSPPARSKEETKKFFQILRGINKDKTFTPFIEAKKELVNDSFKDFIQSRLGYLNGDGKKALQDLLNTQVDKFFCIFTSNDGVNVECLVDKMPQFTIIEIRPVEKHTFLIITSGDNEYDILVGLSWGNGGAGINNPRAMFKLYKKGTRGGGSGEIDLPEDDPQKQEEEEIFDNINSTATLTNEPPIDKKKISKRLENINKKKADALEKLLGSEIGIVNRSGFVKEDPTYEVITMDKGEKKLVQRKKEQQQVQQQVQQQAPQQVQPNKNYTIATLLALLAMCGYYYLKPTTGGSKQIMFGGEESSIEEIREYIKNNQLENMLIEMVQTDTCPIGENAEYARKLYEMLSSIPEEKQSEIILYPNEIQEAIRVQGGRRTRKTRRTRRTKKHRNKKQRKTRKQRR
jgi:hypothetical protein